MNVRRRQDVPPAAIPRGSPPVRTLLIDNYDSYTYNLFQLLAVVNGVEPVVLTNDAAAGDLRLAAFDNAVISPGPGRPDRSRDFGIAAEIIARAEIPVLGVCLGHQGIAAVAGGEVVRAPAARHGHLTRVSHDGRDLFRGIAQGFTAVRYHSLCVADPFPPELEATAWAEDGVNMGLRHRDQPLWGVQFHPESIETQFGYEIVANFRELTASYHVARPAGRPKTSARTAGRRNGPEHVARAADPDSGTTYQLHVRVLDFAADTEAVFTRMFSSSPRAFWLDSAHIEPGLARFSFLGDASGPLAESVVYRLDGAVEVRAGDGCAQRFDGTVFDYLKRELRRRVIKSPELPFDFRCGYVGYFGYELKAICGSRNAHRSGTPDASWLFVDRMIAVDHEAGMTYVLALSDGSSRSAAESVAWLELAGAELSAGHGAVPIAGPQNGAMGDMAAERWLTRDREQYLADIATCKDKLLSGESYEICLTNSVRFPDAGDAYGFYRRLRRSNPAPYAAFLRLDGVEVACSSPERFLRVDADRVVETKPIKGTAPRGRTAEEDRRLRDELTTSTKTRAENLMIVDLLRNDLGRVCEVGSVHVPRLMATETYATVHQLVTTVRGRLRADADLVDCIRACFPGGSMTGAPKLRTMEIIDSLEGAARGVYSGAIGFLGCNGTMDLNIVIRTAVLTDGEWHVGAGGAIVLDSDPVAEYEEMLLKANAVMRAYPASAELTAMTSSPASKPGRAEVLVTP
jgi:para-aminobenzoate synthetase